MLSILDILAVLSLGVCVAAAPTIHNGTQCTFEEIVPSRELKWCPCKDKFYCAKLDVPLDYGKPELGRAAMPLIKRAAVKNSADGPYKGMILTNPGGPGGSGIISMVANSDFYQRVAGSNWDIVSWDPRGLYKAEPKVNCSISVAPGPQKRSQFPGFPTQPDDYYEASIQRAMAIGEVCAEAVGGSKDAGPHMSTAVNVRDLMTVLDAYACTEAGERAENSRLLNFWGFSYGTFVAQTAASMFPERMGRVVVDGTVDPVGFLDTLGVRSLVNTDGVIASFFLFCHLAGREACEYADGSFPKALYDRFQRSWSQLDAEHALTQGWMNATEIQNALSVLKYSLLGITYGPISEFPTFSPYLIDLEKSLEAGEISAWTQKYANNYFDASMSAYPEGYVGVACSDGNGSLFNKTLEDFRSDIDILKLQSVSGEPWGISQLLCTGWSIRSDDFFRGPFGGDTANPILFVGNTYDSATPLASAKRNQPLYKNAGLLIIDGEGHTTLNVPNKCAEDKIRAYFQTGEVVRDAQWCPMEEGAFGIRLNGTLSENLARAGLPGAADAPIPR